MIMCTRMIGISFMESIEFDSLNPCEGMNFKLWNLGPFDQEIIG